MCLLAICMSSLEKYLFRIPPPFFLSLPLFFFFFLVFGCMSCSYILENNSLSVANIFSHSVCCLYAVFMVSFAVLTPLSLIRSHLFIFVFIFITVGASHSVLSDSLQPHEL